MTAPVAIEWRRLSPAGDREVATGIVQLARRLTIACAAKRLPTDASRASFPRRQTTRARFGCLDTRAVSAPDRTPGALVHRIGSAGHANLENSPACR